MTPPHPASSELQEDNLIHFRRFQEVRALAGLAFFACAAARSTAQDEVWSRFGSDRLERFGGSLTFLDDVNADGIDDYAVGAVVGNAAPTPHVGAVRIYSGATHTLLRTVADLGDESFGTAVVRAGDWDGDGIGDLAIGSPTNGNGSVSIVSGADGSLLQTLTSTSPRAQFGATIVSLGEVDGDGVPDYLIGSPNHSTALAAGVGLVELISGDTGAVLNSWVGRSATSQMGQTIADAGDWDNDGLRDAAVIERDGLGTIELVVKVYSSANGATLLSERIAPPGGKMLSSSARLAGDLDGDGRDDFIVVGPSDAFFGVWGTLVAYSPATAGVLFSVVDTNGGFGLDCCGAGDLDGDGADDFAVSRPSGNNGGTVTVFSGATQAELISFNQNNFLLGAALSGGSDLTGDGIAELLVGATSLDFSVSLGKSQVRSLVTGAVVKEKNATNVIDVLQGDACLFDDVDGDGYADLLVGNSSRLDTTERLLLLSGADGHELQRFNKGVQDFGGTLLLLPDLDGDLRSDFAVAAAVGPSSVEVRSGATGTLIRTFTDTRTSIGFGRALAVGVQPSGAIELAIGSPLSDAGRTDGGEFKIFNLATGAQVVQGLGNFTNEQFGAALCHLGDINNDGFGDWGVAAPFNGVNGTNSGRVGLMSGKTGAQIRVIRGTAADDRLGTSVAAIDDVNGDGTPDLVVGVPGAGAGDEGQTLTVSGKNVTILATQTGAAAGAELGSAVAVLVDANSDGQQDLLSSWKSRRRVDLVSGSNGLLMEPVATSIFPRELRVASGPLALLDGPGAGPLLAITATDDATNGAQSGAIAMHKFDDLYLQITPPSAAAGVTVFGKVRGGPNGALFVLLLEDVNGIPVSQLIVASTLDATGAFTASGVVPAGFSGDVYTLRAYAIGFNGKLVDSLPRTLTFE